VFHPNSVEVDVNCHGPIRSAFKACIYIAPTVFYFVDHDVRSERFSVVS
jgi:hypothetical protein|tara:strand:+ start:309 stop:455 length:147 start_codon:yes stop_codon:yes gene_type:complete